MMANSNGANFDVSADDFRASFAHTRALIQNEWPDIEAAALEATGGDMEQIAALVSNSRERASAAVKKQLNALYRAGNAASPKTAMRSMEERLEAVLGRLETQAGQVKHRLQNDVVPYAEAKAKENIWKTIALALGLGLILGLLTGGLSRRG